MGKTTVLLIVFFILIPKNIVFAADVVINEFVPHPSSGNKEWIEFYNPENTDLSSYWVDDDTSFTLDDGNSNKKSLSSINTDNQSFPYIELSSIFNNSGDSIVLFTQEGIIVDQYQYIKDPGTNVSIGRSPDGTGNFAVLTNLTKGGQNTEVLVPTSTSVPIPTLTPTITPSPTQKPTLTPKPTSTPKVSPTMTITPTITANSTALLISSKNTDSEEVDLDENISLPDNILGENISSGSSELVSSMETPTSSPSPKLIQSSEIENNSLSKIILAVGVIFIVCCAILAFRSFKKGKIEEI